MNAITWLRERAARERARRTAYATGGLVHAPRPDDPSITQGGCVFPTGPIATDQPTGFITIDRPLSEHDVEQIRTAFRQAVAPVRPSREHTAALAHAATETAREERLRNNCPCAVIYSRCYCTKPT